MRGPVSDEIERYDALFDADNRNPEAYEESAWYLYDLHIGKHVEPDFNWEDYH